MLGDSDYPLQAIAFLHHASTQKTEQNRNVIMPKPKQGMLWRAVSVYGKEGSTACMVCIIVCAVATLHNMARQLNLSDFSKEVEQEEAEGNHRVLENGQNTNECLKRCMVTDTLFK